MRFVILGATGSVGRTILRILSETKGLQDISLSALSSPQTAGQEVSLNEDRSVTTENPDTFDFQETDIVLSAVSAAVARKYVPCALKAGARVIDKSSAFRKEAPLVVPEVNPQAVKASAQLISSPNCIVIPLSMVLAPLAGIFGLRRVVVSSYQSVSGAGKRGLDTLFSEAKQILMADVPYTDDSPFHQQIAFNVLPQIGAADETGCSEEEIKIQEETKLLMGEEVEVSATAVRVPTFISHGLSVTADFKKAVCLKSSRQALEEAPGLLLSRAAKSPIDAAGLDSCYVSRLRASGKNTLSFWAVCDNLRKGAALNAVQIAQLMVAQKRC